MIDFGLVGVTDVGTYQVKKETGPGLLRGNKESGKPDRSSWRLTTKIHHRRTATARARRTVGKRPGWLFLLLRPGASRLASTKP